VAVDPSRIAASVVTGIGFLAGGAILRSGLTVQGLTTAASLWLVTAIGLSSGAGMYAVSVLATALGVMALTILRRVEGKDAQVARRRISLVLGSGAPTLSEIVASLAESGVIVLPAEYENRLDEGRVYATLEARLPRGASPDDLVRRLESQPGVVRLKIEPAP
jgi:putative Mg2+ transporter-C (MgtC) family protein